METLSLTITGMSTILSKTGRRDEPAQQGHRPRRRAATAGPAQFSVIWTKAAVVAQRRAWQQQSMQSAQLWELDCGLHECTKHCTICKPNINHLVNVLQLKNLYVFLERGTIGICICATTEMSTTLNTNCAPRCTKTVMSRTGPRTAPEETQRSAHSLHCGYPSLNRNIQPLSMN